MPRWAAASRRFQSMSGLLEPGGGPLGRLLVRVFDGLVSDVHVADRGGQPPVPQQLLDRGQADALAIQPRRARVPSTCGVSLVTGPRRCPAAAWPSAVAKVSPPIGPPRSDGNSAARGSSQSSGNWPRTSWTHQISSGRASPSIGTIRSRGPEPREPLPSRTWILPTGPWPKCRSSSRNPHSSRSRSPVSSASRAIA